MSRLGDSPGSEATGTSEPGLSLKRLVDRTVALNQQKSRHRQTMARHVKGSR